MFKTILIANRGEIACRIIETARRMGIRCIAVYSEADKNARHVRLADEAVLIGPAAAKDSYLKGDKILQAAKDKGAEAIHPGYGFLSENADFAKACAKANIKFIGPSDKAINAMGLKDKAKDLMDKAGVPIVPGYQGEKQDTTFLKSEADKIGYPVLIKAVAGGGGKGMRLVERGENFAEALKSCQREAESSFGNAHVLIEKYITRPRHVEVQVFGDSHGNAVHLFERDCSLQRRHQKVVEEAPAPDLRSDVRAALGDAAVKAVQALKYENAGTIEFIMDSETQDFYFMEMNTRLQVEHPVTEMITGQDLVEWQLRVAAGEALTLTQDKITIQGHAFEVRLYAEDPANDFLPQTGTAKMFRIAPKRPEHGSAIRVDTGIESGDSVSVYYDPMVAKIITYGPDRSSAAAIMRDALENTMLHGLNSNQEFLHNIFANDAFLKAEIDTGFIPRHEDQLLPPDYGTASPRDLAVAAVHLLSGDQAPKSSDPWNIPDNWRMNSVLRRELCFTGKGETQTVFVTCEDGVYQCKTGTETISLTTEQAMADGDCVIDGAHITLYRQGRVIALSNPLMSMGDGDDAHGDNRITAPMPGMIIDVMVKSGDNVEKDQPLLVMEAMKMEMTIRAGCAGIIEDLPVAVNDQVTDGALLVAIKAGEAS